MAVIAAIAIPMPGEGAFWIGLGVMIILLGADLYAYAFVANRDAGLIAALFLAIAAFL